MWNQILNKIDQLKSLDKQEQSFGSHHHKYSFNPIIDENQLQEIEKKLATNLPEELKSLYLEVGNGGVGPNFGVLSAFDLYGYKPEKPYQDNLTLKMKMLEKYPEDYDHKDIDDDYFEIDHDDITGLIVIIQEGCGHETCIVSNGEKKGNIVYLSGDGNIEETSKTLIDVYEEWLDKELEIFNHVKKMISSKENYDDISKSLEEEFQIYSAGDVIVSILDIEKPISLFGTHESQIHHGAVQFPWYREQLQKSYEQTKVTLEKKITKAKNEEKTPKTKSGFSFGENNKKKKA